MSSDTLVASGVTVYGGSVTLREAALVGAAVAVLLVLLVWWRGRGGAPGR